jgi:hypothetical protein
MELLRLDDPLDDLGPDPVLVLALDGWTDAGEGGTAAAEALRESAPTRPPDRSLRTRSTTTATVGRSSRSTAACSDIRGGPS